MPTPITQEWLNQNALRRYPFREDCNLVPAEAPDVTLPSYLLVDFVLTVASDTTVRVSLQTAAFVGGFLTCVFVDDNGDSVTTLTVNTTTHEPYSSYPLTGQGDYDDARGVAVLGDLARLTSDLPDGAYTFSDAPMEAATVRPALRGVRSVRVGYDNTLSDFIRGNIKLLEGSNIRLTYDPAQNSIRIDAVDGAGFNQECECEETYERPEPIRLINGINAEEVLIVGDGKCVEVTTNGNTITISDTCSSPCCGCPELEFLTSRLELQESVLRRVEEYATRMEGQLNNTIDTMLASTKGG